jgi:hypothetical protein
MVNPVSKRAGKGQRCAVCGNIIRTTDNVYRISKGSLKTAGWTEKGEWGYIHRPCFALATQSPDALMAELKRQAAT